MKDYYSGIGCFGELILALLVIYILYHLDPLTRFLNRLIGA